MSMRRTALAADVAPTPSGKFAFDKFEMSGASTERTLEWKDLSETEKSAASLGVDPTALKPIRFLNEAHYDTLLKTNAVDSELAKRLEAFKNVSTASSSES